MTLEEYKKENYTSYYSFGQALGIEGYNPACMAQRWCLTCDGKYFVLPSSEMMVKIQDEITKGKVTIEDMVREHAKRKKEYEQSK
jgi:hypothetical protein